jgi:hypothetical protein
MNGADIVCKKCKYFETVNCLKWEYWKNVTAEYAEMCGKCEDKEYFSPPVRLNGVPDKGYDWI